MGWVMSVSDEINERLGSEFLRLDNLLVCPRCGNKEYEVDHVAFEGIFPMCAKCQTYLKADMCAFAQFKMLLYILTGAVADKEPGCR